MLYNYHMESKINIWHICIIGCFDANDYSLDLTFPHICFSQQLQDAVAVSNEIMTPSEFRVELPQLIQFRIQSRT